MGIRLVEGRDFRASDQILTPRVAIVNRKFADYYFGGKSPIGHYLGRGGPTGTGYDVEIVGMVEDSMYEGPREGVHKQVFVPHYGKSSAAVYVRAATNAAQIYSQVRETVKRLDSRLPIYELKTLESQFDDILLTERLIALLSAGFGLLATLLAAIGLYGVMAFVVTRRTKEMGVRMALGAKQSEVIWLVMKEVLLLLALGLAVGLPSAALLGRYIASQLYGIQPGDPMVAGVTMLVLIAVATLAGFIPARRASRIDPILALRYE